MRSAQDRAATTALAPPTTPRMRNNRPLTIIPRLSPNTPDAGPMPRRVPWRFVALAVVLLIFLGWGLAPDDRRRRLLDTVSQYPRPAPPSHFDLDEPPIVQTPPKSPAKPPKKPSADAAHPLTFAEDPNPASTTHCTTPHTPKTPLVQWALMIDAGSTGSRIHVYKFNNCGPSPAYEYEVFRTTQPGLSSFPDDPEAAARSLDVLLDVAQETIPETLRRCTPVSIKATAGLRVLGETQSGAILDAVRAHVTAKYPFRLVEKGGVEIMDGRDEGVYAWITANYLLGTLALTGSYAVLDLGGASTQIVFAPAFPTPLAEGEHKYVLNFSGSTHTLYQHSYLGYGLMLARQRVHRLVNFLHGDGKDGKDGKDVPNPCISQGTTREIELADPARTVQMAGKDVGSFEACSRVVDLVLAKDALCPLKPCSFAGVYHPPLRTAFPHGNVLLLSYFYDRLAPLLPPPSKEGDGTLSLSLGALAAIGARVCGGATAWEGKGKGDAQSASAGADADITSPPWTPADAEFAWSLDWTLPDVHDEISGRPEYCLDLTFMHGLLRGYGLGQGRVLTVAKQIAGTEMGWCLGAELGVVSGGGVECVA